MKDLRSDLRSLAKRWSEASLERLPDLPDLPIRLGSRPRPWPMLGMFSAGLVLGALGYYALTHRAQITRLASLALTDTEVELDEFNGEGGHERVSVTTHRPNHRRKASVENA